MSCVEKLDDIKCGMLATYCKLHKLSEKSFFVVALNQHLLYILVCKHVCVSRHKDQSRNANFRVSTRHARDGFKLE